MRLRAVLAGRARRAALVALAVDAAWVVLGLIFGGQPDANSHPYVRSGGQDRYRPTA